MYTAFEIQSLNMAARNPYGEIISALKDFLLGDFRRPRQQGGRPDLGPFSRYR